MLEAELAVDALYDSDFAALAERAAQARSTAAALDDPGLRAMTAALDCFAHYGQGRLAEAEAARAESAAALDSMDDDQLAGRLEAPYYLGFAEFLCERYEDAIVHTQRGLDVSRATGQGQFVVPMMVGLAHALEVRGRLDEALDMVEGAVEAARLSGNRQILSWALVGEGWVAAMTGDLERAGRAADEAVALLGELSDSILTLATHALAALVFLEAGDVERCLAEAEAAGAPDFDAIEPGRAAWLLAVLARAELARGRPDAARDRIARARARARGPVAAADRGHRRPRRGAARARATTRPAPPRSPRPAPRWRTVSARSSTPRGCARSPVTRSRRPATATRRCRCSGAPRPSWRRAAPSDCAPRRCATCAGSASASPARQRRGAAARAWRRSAAASARSPSSSRSAARTARSRPSCS